MKTIALMALAILIGSLSLAVRPAKAGGDNYNGTGYVNDMRAFGGNNAW